jgi:hypothetical protein
VVVFVVVKNKKTKANTPPLQAVFCILRTLTSKESLLFLVPTLVGVEKRWLEPRPRTSGNALAGSEEKSHEEKKMNGLTTTTKPGACPVCSKDVVLTVYGGNGSPTQIFGKCTIGHILTETQAHRLFYEEAEKTPQQPPPP